MKNVPALLWIVPAVVIGLAVFDVSMPSWFYQAFPYVISVSALALAYVHYKYKGYKSSPLLFAGIAVIYNPFVAWGFFAGAWTVVHVASAITYVVHFMKFK